ncbi:TetM/TetW/TetO/TetS family tetracycline resistance ribosomal protection protein [Paenibacillus sp. KQZ6P-2]|uniref:TetM/TetW/TetO/TetS family tetracycline resistance ribosomal protection protein n=1 Tax=Paenibacillus mangrovi TaxID=2931978 RepID=A0A9X2B3S1_9BACL|nr:TetM/TetW/TetO/TetS family tetracycline resistance ribosomal protection protein [Paenibacillus mangrovi]MCJ8013726.1 TetM/TetW/TetO/TetS family tetracycline resistance ribosomal protection protein [Paenibacillus mangrovi]
MKNMYKTIGLLAHVDAGKTTFAEQLLYHTNSIRNRGRVDHKDAFLDSHELERARGITIFADQAVMTCGSSTYYLIDTPGHVDFSAEMERAIQVMDYAIIIISAVEGVEGHTETVWQLLQKIGIPVLFFVNKIDRAGANVDAVLEQIRLQLTPDAFLISGSLTEEMTEDVIEFTAERDELLLNAYLEGHAETSMVISAISSLLKRRLAFPVMCGSALQDQGIAEFLNNLELLTKTAYDTASPFAASVYKIRHDQQGVRLTFLRMLQGKLSVRDELTYIDSTGEEQREKITSIRLYNGEKYASIDEAAAGQLIAVTGLTMVSTGQSLGASHERTAYELVPALKSKVIYDRTIPIREVLRCFHILDAEDPSLGVVWDEALQELHIHVMGTIQLEVLAQVVQDRFGFAVSFGKPEILYKETIVGKTLGYGHFEPLGHYAEVHLLIEAGPTGSGVTFVNQCHPDDLSVGFQNLVGQHVTEKDHRGLLTGSPLTDIIVTLLTGRAHNKHTTGGDFREATLRALRQGLEKADNRILEPYYAFKLKVDVEHIGRVMSDIQQAQGSFEPPEMLGDKAIFTGEAPVSLFMNYASELASFTKGKGALTLRLNGYKPCRSYENIIASKNYDKNADPEYTSSSIFCSKGKAFGVDWHEAENYMIRA